MNVVLDFLSRLDVSLFHFFNVTLANPVFDKIMPVITQTAYWRPVAAAAAIFWLWKGGNKGRWAVLFGLVAWGGSDLVNSFLVKHFFARPRPCWTLADVHLLVGCGQIYSFPSGHAVTSFAIATFLGLVYRRARIGLFALAALVSYSRIAVGVHYPFDVLAGMAEGALFGFVFYRLFLAWKMYMEKKGWRAGW